MVFFWIMVISSDPNFLAVKKVAVTPSAIFADAEEAVHKLPGVEVHRLVQGIQKIYN